MYDFTFVYLPFASPIMPPLSIPTLVSFLKMKGINSDAFDLNIEFYHYLLEEKNRQNGYEKINHKLLLISPEKLYSPTVKDLLNLKVREKRNIASFNNAYQLFTRKRAASNYQDIFLSCDIIYSSLKAATYDLEYLNNNPENYYFTIPATEYYRIVNSISWNFIIKWLYKRLDFICKTSDKIGFSICYVNQIHFLLIACSYIKKTYPNILICVGGPVITGILKGGDINLSENFLKNHSHLIDIAIVEDGEYAIFDLLRNQKNEQLIYPPFNQYQSTRSRYTSNSIPCLPPSFSVLPLELYLTPELTLPMITSRHCYWAKCRFCSHSIGYHSYIQYKPIDVINSLQEISEKYSVQNIYLVDECTSPFMARQISTWIKNSSYNIHWMAEMRFEKELLDYEYIKLLYDGGCRYLAFGLESANNRVLNTMNKGTNIYDADQIIKNCHQVGLHINLMFFFGFPTETKKEAMDTFTYICNNHSKISGIGMGSFTLTPQSYVYKNFKKFGIADVSPDGRYTATIGLTQQESKELLIQAQKIIKQRFYRGHKFYHRTFYLINLPAEDQSKYPLGFIDKKILYKNHFPHHPIRYKYNAQTLYADLVYNPGIHLVLLFSDIIPDSSIFIFRYDDWKKLQDGNFLNTLDSDTLEHLWKGGILIENQ